MAHYMQACALRDLVTLTYERLTLK